MAKSACRMPHASLATPSVCVALKHRKLKLKQPRAIETRISFGLDFHFCGLTVGQLTPPLRLHSLPDPSLPICLICPCLRWLVCQSSLFVQVSTWIAPVIGSVPAACAATSAWKMGLCLQLPLCPLPLPVARVAAATDSQQFSCFVL